MRKLMTLFFVLVIVSCGKQVKIDDTSLKINIQTANDACSCNDVAIAIMKEEEMILTEAKKTGDIKSGSALHKELMKRDEKSDEYFRHCQPIYEHEGLGRTCPNYKEADELDKKVTKLRSEVKIL